MSAMMFSGSRYRITCESNEGLNREVLLVEIRRNLIGNVEYLFESSKGEKFIVEEIGGIVYPFVWYNSKRDLLLMDLDLVKYPFSEIEQMYVDIVEIASIGKGARR